MKNQKIIILANNKIDLHYFVKPVSCGRFIEMERRIAQARTYTLNNWSGIKAASESHPDELTQVSDSGE
ncbi:hypothetical protein QZQ97_15190 [Serratia sp. root2]|uniref:hypothetical protein n=1 Tax=Serratia sp. root2 TaxID=3059676 RepID=UPI0028904B90|nr:hypothetical protein [Serratia sp. root2]MDT3252267.1 hypothetical protein [Serratia sp. root2]